MKILAYLLTVVGVLIAVIAFNLDVTVGDTGIVNMNMMAQRQNLLIVGCVGFLAGIGLLIGTQQQGGSKGYRKIEEQDENETPKDDGVGVRLASAIKAGSDSFEKYVLRGDGFVSFWSKTIGGVFSAIIGASLVDKIIRSIVYSDFFYHNINININIWGHSEIFYIPVMVLIFLAVMRNGCDVLIRIFYLETAACIAGTLFFELTLGGNWLEIITFFSFEMGASVLGIVLMKNLPSRFFPLTE